MKTLRLILLLIFALNCAVACAGNATNRVNVELSDGSRIVGQSVKNKITFHSALLGDFKIDVSNIRDVNRVATNSLTLRTAAGDTMTVSFVDPEFAIQTSFGNLKLPVSSIRRLTVAGSAFETRLSGLVSFWQGGDLGRDSVGTNDAHWIDISYADSPAGQVFSLNGSSTWATIPASPSLDVGRDSGFTVSVWIKPFNVTSFRPIVEWNDGTDVGVHLWLGHLPRQNGELFANVIEAGGTSHQIFSDEGAVVPGEFQNVALTYDKAGGLAELFVNGEVVARQDIGSFRAKTGYDLLISRRPGDHPGDWTYNSFFSGLMDNIAVYNRALSADEIKSICDEDHYGDLSPRHAEIPLRCRASSEMYDNLDVPRTQPEPENGPNGGY